MQGVGGRWSWRLVALLFLAAPLAGRAAEDVTRRLVGAASRGDAAQVVALLRAGAPPDAGDRGGWTALHEAALKGDLAVARALLDGGARLDLRARSGGTPLDVAERNGRVAFAALLRERGARGSGKSIGDTVCVRPWRGDGYCGEVLAVDATRFRLRVSGIVGCAAGCAAEAGCSAGRVVGLALRVADELWVPASCLTHTGVAR